MSSNIQKIIENIDLSKNYVLALSGGVDSSVLAHILAKLSAKIRLVFVQHNQKDSKKLEIIAEKRVVFEFIIRIYLDNIIHNQTSPI